MDQITFEVRSIVPLLMHRYAGEQPSMEKAPRGKKTQAHIDAAHKRDWLQSAYWANGTFYLPAEMIEAALSEAAKAFRGGTTFKKALAVQDLFIPLRIFKNPEDTKGFQAKGELEDYYVPEYKDIRGVGIGDKRIDRCRPIFREWGLKFTVGFDSSEISQDQVVKAVGAMAVGDFRPRFGRCRIVSQERIKVAA